MMRHTALVVAAVAAAGFWSACAPMPPMLSPSPVLVHEPGVPGSADAVGCGDHLWQHVYNPERLLIKTDCVTVTGFIMDATARQSRHEADGVRHEADGDTHGWLKVDPPFRNLLNAGNLSDEEGNLVFEIICHFVPRAQLDAQPACADYSDSQQIPAVGTHVAMTGT